MCRERAVHSTRHLACDWMVFFLVVTERRKGCTLGEHLACSWPLGDEADAFILSFFLKHFGLVSVVPALGSATVLFSIFSSTDNDGRKC